MKLIISPRAERQLKKIPKVEQIAIVRKVRLLKNSSHNPNKEKLSGYNTVFRVRVGHYRIVFKQTKKLIYFVLIGHHKDIYRLLQQLFD